MNLQIPFFSFSVQWHNFNILSQMLWGTHWSSSLFIKYFFTLTWVQLLGTVPTSAVKEYHTLILTRLLCFSLDDLDNTNTSCSEMLKAELHLLPDEATMNSSTHQKVWVSSTLRLYITCLSLWLTHALLIFVKMNGVAATQEVEGRWPLGSIPSFTTSLVWVFSNNNKVTFFVTCSSHVGCLNKSSANWNIQTKSAQKRLFSTAAVNALLQSRRHDRSTHHSSDSDAVCRPVQGQEKDLSTATYNSWWVECQFMENFSSDYDSQAFCAFCSIIHPTIPGSDWKQHREGTENHLQ